MDAVKVGQITNADVYLNEEICVGRFSEFDDPDIEYETVKHAALGMVGEYEAPGRLLKAIKGKGDSDFLDTDVMRRFSDPTQVIPLTIDGYCDIFGENGLLIEKGYRIITHVSILVFKTGGKSWKFGNDFKGPFEWTASRYVRKHTDRTVPLREIDIMNQINRVDGRDVWPRY